MRNLLKPGVRRYAYRVAGAGLAVAGVYGVVDGEKSAALLVLCAALFGVADQNVNDEG